MSAGTLGKGTQLVNCQCGNAKAGLLGGLRVSQMSDALPEQTRR